MQTTPMLSFPKAIKKAFRDYAVFSGRSRRSEFWWFALFNTVVTVGLQFAFFTISVITGLVWVKFLVYLYSLATLIPSFAVAVRRLHDTGRSGGWTVGLFFSAFPMIPTLPLAVWNGYIWAVVILSLCALICLAFSITILVFCASDSSTYSNKYGPSPKYID